MKDAAIDLIEGAPSSDISFQWFRSALKADHDLKGTLQYGHAVIDSVAGMDQYLYTYGPMIESQWECVNPLLKSIDLPVRWIDYGCGQGLAGLLLSDLTCGRSFSRVTDVLLIEPSAPALARAAALYKRIVPTATIRTVCKRFDDVSTSDIRATRSRTTLHLFSNSLDVPGFDPLSLLKTMMRSGRHTILSVSHDRDFNGGTPRIEGVKATFEAHAAKSNWTLRGSEIYRFTCSNGRQSKGVAWLCEVEIDDG